MGVCMCMHVAWGHHTTYLVYEHGKHAHNSFFMLIFPFSSLLFSLLATLSLCFSLLVAFSCYVSKTSDVPALLCFFPEGKEPEYSIS